MNTVPTRCLILACGNTLRGDDGVAPWLAAWAGERFEADPRVEVIAGQQWTPELAGDIARAGSVLFVDCSIVSAPGSVELAPVSAAAGGDASSTHHLGAPELLALARELYDSAPDTACLLTIGAGSTEMGEQFSAEVSAALPEACRRLEQTVLRLLSAG
ncbi:MAG TPA: hydrogenase maturation protease [Terracidiphilus sp.]|nr:hydrogenase maturation protease [Terracidiphilus sp.]